MSFIYIGPNRLRDGLRKYTIYQDNPKDIVESLKDKFSLVDRLFVAVDDLEAAVKEVNRKGTPRNRAFQQIGGDE